MTGISLFFDDLGPAPPVPQAEETQYAVEQTLEAVEGAEEE